MAYSSGNIKHDRIFSPLKYIHFEQELNQEHSVACVKQGVTLDDHNGPFWP